jgi:hypothetical protein
MGNRMMKETIRTSKTVNSMTDFQFRTWVYLITYVDDYGRGSADPELLKGFVFPRRKGVTEQTIAKTLAELATIGSIRLYEVDGEAYLCFPNWSEHQRIQQKRSKFPEPPDDFDASQKSTVSYGDIPSETKPNQTEYETEIEYETEVETETEAKHHASVVSDFDEFWACYPKKVGKEAAKKSFAKVKSKVPLRTLLNALETQKASEQWRKNGGQFIPNPTTWLNQGRWEDELPQNSAYQADPVMDELRRLHDVFSAEEAGR